MNIVRTHQIDPATFEELSRHLVALRSLITVLNEDIDRFRAADDGAGRRALIRAVFAYIEGTSFGFRFSALHLARLRNVALTVGEKLMARETTYVLNEKGQVEERLALSSPLANLRFALTIFAKISGVPYELSASDSNFEHLQQGQRIRNRLAHPRSSLDLKVSSEEKALVLTAVDWVVEQQTHLLAAFVFRLYSSLQRFYSGVEQLPKTENGGYSAEEVAFMFSEALTCTSPISLDEAVDWFSRFLKAND